MTDTTLQIAFEYAKKAREHSYSPFSRFKVGAAVIMQGSDRVYSGCNVENSSYGGTICAERSAIVSAVSAEGSKPIEAVVVVTDVETLTVPCAICLQFIAEFAFSETKIHLADLSGIKETWEFSALLPKPFRFGPGGE